MSELSLRGSSIARAHVYLVNALHHFLVVHAFTPIRNTPPTDFVCARN